MIVTAGFNIYLLELVMLYQSMCSYVMEDFDFLIDFLNENRIIDDPILIIMNVDLIIIIS